MALAEGGLPAVLLRDGVGELLLLVVVVEVGGIRGGSGIQGRGLGVVGVGSSGGVGLALGDGGLAGITGLVLMLVLRILRIRVELRVLSWGVSLLRLLESLLHEGVHELMVNSDLGLLSLNLLAKCLRSLSFLIQKCPLLLNFNLQRGKLFFKILELSLKTKVLSLDFVGHSLILPMNIC